MFCVEGISKLYPSFSISQSSAVALPDCVQNVLIGGRIYDLTAFNMVLPLVIGCFTNCTESAWR